MTDENQADVQEVVEPTEVETDETTDAVETEVETDDAETEESEETEEPETVDEPQAKHRILNSDNTSIPGEMIDFIHGNLVRAFIEEAQNLPTLWEKMGDDAREEYKERVTQRAGDHIIKIATAINGQNFEKCVALVDTVTNKDEVKIVLKTHDMDGGEKFFRRAGGGTVICIFADEKEYLNAKGMPQIQKQQPDLLEEAEAAEDGEDPLYQEAVDLVIAEGRVSISLVQREIKIGYNRAARIIETMEINGVVSTADESGQRTILELDESEPQADDEVVADETVSPMLFRSGSYDLIIGDENEVETSVTANDLEDAAAQLGYTEFKIENQGTESEFALILDDERVRDDGLSIHIEYSENQPETGDEA